MQAHRIDTSLSARPFKDWGETHRRTFWPYTYTTLNRNASASTLISSLSPSLALSYKAPRRGKRKLASARRWLGLRHPTSAFLMTAQPLLGSPCLACAADREQTRFDFSGPTTEASTWASNASQSYQLFYLSAFAIFQNPSAEPSQAAVVDRSPSPKKHAVPSQCDKGEAKQTADNQMLFATYSSNKIHKIFKSLHLTNI